MLRNIKTYHFDDEALLGEGGFARVFLARDEQKGAEAALKILKPEFEGDERIVRSFFHDPQIMMALEHPHIIRIFDVGSSGEKPFFLSMEFCAGGDLRAMIQQRRKIPISQMLPYALTLCEALSYCHRANVLHRDIKASNILFKDEHTPVLSDFGSESEGSGEGARTTTYVGSPPYLSPEVWDQRAYEARSDLYSFGVLLYYALTGRLPFFADDSAGFRRLHLTQAPTAPSTWSPGISRELDDVILALLEKEPNNRIPTADDLQTELDRIYRRSYADPERHHRTKLLLYGPGSQRTGLHITQFPYRIGKSEERSGDQRNDYMIGHDDSYVSRFHAVIDKIDESYIFTDVSTNGCTINGVRIHRQSVELMKENQIILGSTTEIGLNVVPDGDMTGGEREAKTSILAEADKNESGAKDRSALLTAIAIAVLMVIVTLVHFSCMS